MNLDSWFVPTGFSNKFVDLISLLVLFLFDLLPEQKSKIRDSNDNFSNALLKH